MCVCVPPLLFSLVTVTYKKFTDPSAWPCAKFKKSAFKKESPGTQRCSNNKKVARSARGFLKYVNFLSCVVGVNTKTLKPSKPKQA